MKDIDYEDDDLADDQKIGKWWDSICDDGYWSGAIINTKYEELWPDAKSFVNELYNSPRGNNHAMQR